MKKSKERIYETRTEIEWSDCVLVDKEVYLEVHEHHSELLWGTLTISHNGKEYLFLLDDCYSDPTSLIVGDRLDLMVSKFEADIDSRFPSDSEPNTFSHITLKSFIIHPRGKL